MAGICTARYNRILNTMVTLNVRFFSQGLSNQVAVFGKNVKNDNTLWRVSGPCEEIEPYGKAIRGLNFLTLQNVATGTYFFFPFLR